MKTCPVCQSVVHGRADKKFCCDDCRASFHNQKNYQVNRKIRKINRILRKNRQILLEFVQKDQIRIPTSRLQKMGFDFDYHTGEWSCSSDEAFKACYDIPYQLVEEDQHQYVIIKKQIGMKTP